MITIEGADPHQTTVFKRTSTGLIPYWNETFELFRTLGAVRDSSNIQIEVFDQRKYKRYDQGCLGSVSIKVGDVLDLLRSATVSSSFPYLSSNSISYVCSIIIQNLDLQPGADGQFVHSKVMFSP